MNPIQSIAPRPSNPISRKKYVGGLLELACRDIELPKSRFDAAKIAYESVGEHLSDSTKIKGFEPRIFPQGSMSLGTTVKPLDREEFDVDLICHLQRLKNTESQAAVKTLVGKCLEEYEKKFGPSLTEHKRCWRLNYAEASRLHLDITPAVHNLECLNKGLAVPDKDKRRWEPTHPEGYVKWFERKAALSVRIGSQQFAAKEALAVDPLPENERFKGILKRSVQLLKRHRSIMFQGNADLAPISVIITTLAAKSYERICITGQNFDSEFDVLFAIISGLPQFVERRMINERSFEYWVPNETTAGENFAEKWNNNFALYQAFDGWQKKALQDFGALAESEDAPKTFHMLEACTGNTTSRVVQSLVTERISRNRVGNLLRTSSLGTINLVAGGSVKANTFFGNQE